MALSAEDLWEKAKTRQRILAIEIGRTEDGQALNRAHRRKHLLSGLLKCGACGGGYTIMSKDRYGCATRRTQGTCDNSHTIGRHEIEARVLSGLKRRLLAPELVEAFMADYQEEMNRLRRDADASRKAEERELARIREKIARTIRAIEDGLYTLSMKESMLALEACKAELEMTLSDMPAAAPLRLHPKLAERFAEKVDRLEDALEDPVDRPQAAGTIRSMIDRTLLTRGKSRLCAELHGDLAEIVAICDEASGHKESPGQRIRGVNCR